MDIASLTFRIARTGLHRYEEPCISGENGSGTVFFSGCDMHCPFCQNAEISHGGKGVNVNGEELLSLFLLIVNRIECLNGHELGLSEDLPIEIRRLQRNIEYAESGEFDLIEEEGHLKHDPVEWTQRWEEVIDEADKIAYERLADHPRGMGFCHAYWYERAQVLEENFGIIWRSPSLMNPGVIFD